MRQLLPVPDSALDPVTFIPRAGSYRGSLPRVDLRAREGGLFRRIAREKRWFYFAIASGDLFVAAAVVKLGYAANMFAFAFDAKRGMLVDRSSVGPVFAASVGDSVGEASYRFGGASFRLSRSVGRSCDAYEIDLRARELEIRATLDTAGAPPSLTAIATIEGGLVNTTEKRALLDVRGHAIIRGERRDLDGGIAGYDYTHGLLARHTAWRWGFALGRAKTGERIALNLVQGFVGEAECGAWVDGELYPLAEGRFDFDESNPEGPWHVTTEGGGVDLRFVPGGMHAERKNLGLVRSRFIQPVGSFTGTLRAGDREFVLDRVLGVTEDQDVIW